jgi:hypothetical protein
MPRLRGWGLLFALALPLLVYFSWSQLGSQSGRINLERFADTIGGDAAGFAGPLAAFFKKNGRLAVPGDVQLDAPPPKSGIKHISVQPDGILHVEIDAKISGKPVVLRIVPIVMVGKNGSVVDYECLSDTSPVHVGRFCRAETLKSVDDIPAQLLANIEALKSAPAKLDGSGSPIKPGSAMGSALNMPANTADQNNCGFQCVKPLSCANARALACSRSVTEGNARWNELSATPDLHRGTDIATVNDAIKLCKSLGAEFSVAEGGGLGGVIKLSGGGEYWVHDKYSPEKNCWSGS